MYRLIIVDDEEVIRNGLRTVVDWESLGFTVVGCFANGNAALAFLREHRVDCVLADIRMPHLSGLDLARILMVDRPEVPVVILSGYNEFSYAQEAIDLNIFKYLLKPIKEAQLRDVFERIRNSLESRDPDIDNTHRLVALREAAVEAWFSRGTVAPPPPSAIQSIDELRPEAKSVLLLEPRIATREDQPIDLVGVCAALRRAITHSLPAIQAWPFLLRSAVQVAVIIAGDSVELAQEVFELAEEEISTYPGIRNSAALGREVEEIDSIPLSFSHAEKVLLHRMYLGLSRLILPEEITEIGDSLSTTSEGDHPFPSSVIETMSDLLVTGSENAIEEAVHECFEQLRRRCIISGETVRALLLSLLVRLHARLSTTAPALSDGIPGEAQLSRELQDCITLDEYEGRILGLFREALRRQDRGSGRSAIIHSAITYIQESYGADLSLDEVAEVVGVSAGYLSRLFRQVTGETFKAYLTRLRLQEAKRLLSGGSDRVYQIAERVGYNDQHYFSEVFRKETGLTPLEYRNRVSGAIP